MTDSDTSTQMMDRLAQAAWNSLAETAYGGLHIDDVAADADIDPLAARAVAGDVGALVMHQLARLDRRAVLESLADIHDAGDVPVRERIMEAVMHRFEVYAPYRAQIAQLDRAARTNPLLGVRLAQSLTRAVRMLLGMAGDDLSGLRGEARVRGVVGVVMSVSRTWHKDDTPDLAMTMKQIDSQLARAEEWGRSFRVFGFSSARGDTDAGEGAIDGDAPGGVPGSKPKSAKPKNSGPKGSKPKGSKPKGGNA